MTDQQRPSLQRAVQPQQRTQRPASAQVDLSNESEEPQTIAAPGDQHLDPDPGDG